MPDMPEGALGFRVAGEVRVFPLRELDAAKAWVTE
jgi:hypothetical protein